VTGTSAVQNGILYFTDPLNQQGQVDIVNGVFTIPDVKCTTDPATICGSTTTMTQPGIRP